MNTATAIAAERVCLVDEENRPIGECLKSSVHGENTPLHRAFSIFLFGTDNRLLMQQRSFVKKTWPGIWSNSCCGHPAPFESNIDAAHRRLDEELGVAGGQLFEALPDFRYRSRYRGIEENEICPVFVGRIDAPGNWNRRELQAVSWIDWDTFLQLINSGPSPAWGDLSPWCKWEARLLDRLGPRLLQILSCLNTFKPSN